MKNWYQFSDGHTVSFGHSTKVQAQGHLATLNDRRAVNHYAMTELGPKEEPLAKGLIVDLDSGMTLPTRYKTQHQPQA